MPMPKDADVSPVVKVVANVCERDLISAVSPSRPMLS